MTKKGNREAILRITDRDTSSRQVAIHNTAGDSYELFPTCHSLCSAAEVIVVLEISLWHLQRESWLTFLGDSFQAIICRHILREGGEEKA